MTIPKPRLALTAIAAQLFLDYSFRKFDYLSPFNCNIAVERQLQFFIYPQ